MDWSATEGPTSDEQQSRLYPTAVFLPILSAFAFLLSVPPCVIQAKARNFAATVLATGIAFLNLSNFVNAVIWPKDDIDTWFTGVGLCDVDIKLVKGFWIAIDGAVVCIFRQLAIILDTENVILVPSTKEKWRRRSIEAIFCVALPVYSMIMQYIFQPDRFAVLAISGCRSTFWLSWPSIVLYLTIQPIICLIASAYGAVAVWRLIRYRQQVSTILASSQSSVSRSRFIRLFIMSAILLLGYIPLTGYWLSLGAGEIRRFSWKIVHYQGWSGFIIYQAAHGHVLVDRWISAALGFLLFMVFGMSEETLKMYRNWTRKLRLDQAGLYLYCRWLECKKTSTRSSSGHSCLVTREDEKNSAMTTVAESRQSKLDR